MAFKLFGGTFLARKGDESVRVGGESDVTIHLNKYLYL